MHLESIPESMFRETEAGLIPTEWKCLPLKAIVTFTRKPRGLDLSSLEEIPFVPMELISEQDVYITQYALLTNEEIKSSTYCERGDLLIAKITPSFENGKQGILADIPLDFAFATTEVYALKAIACAVDLLFLFAYFKLDYVRENIAGKMEGTTGRQRVPKSILANYPIPSLHSPSSAASLPPSTPSRTKSPLRATSSTRCTNSSGVRWRACSPTGPVRRLPRPR